MRNRFKNNRLVKLLSSRLEIKILSLVMILVVVGFGVFAIFNVRQTSVALRTQKEDSNSVLSSQVVSSIQNTMLAGKGPQATSALDNLRNVPEVDRIQVFSTRGQEVFAGNLGASKQPVSQVFSVLKSGQRTRFYETRNGVQYLVDVRPLPNDRACQQCHGSSNPLRGVVLVSTSMADVQSAIGREEILMAFVFIGGLVVLLGALWLSLHVVVLAPLKKVMGGIRNLSGGDLNHRVEVTSADEVGELARSFNRMADSLGESQDRLRRANLDLLEANRLKSEFLSVMSHELRTPLNAIIGFSEVLMDQDDSNLSERQTRFLTNIETSGRHLLKLVNDILDLSAVGSDNAELEKEDISVPQMMEDVRKLGHPFAAQRRIWLDVKPSEALPLLHADAAKIKRILYNLVSNAIKFTPEGGRVTISARLRDGMVEISVADTGIGISDEDQEKIFDHFGQVESNHARRYEGAGVGLALTKKLVELHGGRIRVKSELGKGSTFTIALPVTGGRRETDWKTAGNTIEPEVQPEASPNQPLVLVIEDDPQTSELIGLWLEESGYRVARAFDGEQGLKLARELRPFAVTLDILLPKLDGWDVLQELKQASETSEIPVIIISILERSRRGLEMGAFDYFVKPVEKRELICRLESHSLYQQRRQSGSNGPDEN
ncbi:MAG: ATP-binding protein [Thermoleophilia bacterium]